MKYDKPLGIVLLMTYQYHMLHSTVPTPNKIWEVLLGFRVEEPANKSLRRTPISLEPNIKYYIKKPVVFIQLSQPYNVTC